MANSETALYVLKGSVENTGINALIQQLPTEDQITVHSIQNTEQPLLLLRSAQAGILLFVAVEPKDLELILEAMKLLKPKLEDGTFCLLGMCYFDLGDKAALFEKKGGCAEFFAPNTPVKTLRHKLKRWMDSVEKYWALNSVKYALAATQPIAKAPKPAIAAPTPPMPAEQPVPSSPFASETKNPIKSKITAWTDQSGRLSVELGDFFGKEITLFLKQEHKLQTADYIYVRIELPNRAPPMAFTVEGIIEEIVETSPKFWSISLSLIQFDPAVLQEFYQTFEQRQNIVSKFLKNSKGS